MLEAFLFENSLKLLELSKGVLMLLRIPLGSRHHTLQVLDGLSHHEHLGTVSRSPGMDEDADDILGRSSHVLSASSASADQLDDPRPMLRLMLAICVCRLRTVIVILEACAKMLPS